MLVGIAGATAAQATNFMTLGSPHPVKPRAEILSASTSHEEGVTRISGVCADLGL